MRGGLAVGLVSALLVARVQAADFTTHDEWEVRARAPALLAAILAYDQTCDHGCRYRAPHVARTVILDHERRPDSFYVWTLVEDVQRSAWFSHVSVVRRARTVQVDVRMVPPEKVRELEAASGERSDPAFDAALATYVLEETFAEDRFVATRISFRNALSASGLTGFLGGGIIRRRMNEARDAVYANLRAASSP